MNASEIENVISDFIDPISPYKCILIDGKWGIGKTYAVKEAQHKISHAVYISLFGMKTMEQIYIEMLSQLSLSQKFEKITGVVNKILHMTTQSENKVIAAASNLLFSRSGIVSCLQAMCERKNDQAVNIGRDNLIIIDDIERMDDSLYVDELFGLLDAIRTDTNYKLVLVANTEKMSEDKNTIFTEYSEKVIDRTYNITEVSPAVWQENDKFDDHFVSEFWTKHHFSNLRTLQKAEYLYKDIKAKIDAGNISYKDDCVKLKFEKMVHLVCYAVVFEVVDKIYSNVSEQKEYGVFKSLMEKPDYRIAHMYLGNASNEVYALVVIVRHFFENNEPLDYGVFQSYADFLGVSNTKNAFYLSQKEITLLIEALVDDINIKKLSTIELCDKANMAVSWMSILGMDSGAVLKTIGDKIYTNETLSMFPPKDYSNPAYSSICSICNLDSYDAIKDTLLNVKKRIIEAYWNQFFEYCRKEIIVHKYEDVLNLLELAKENINNSCHSGYIKNGIGQLLTSELAPVGSLDENAYACLHSLCYIANKLNPSVMYNFLQKVKQEYNNDKMATHRIHGIYEQFPAICECEGQM